MNRAFVVDASATLKLLIDEPDSDHARRFFGRLADPTPPLLYVPDLLYAECANVLWKYVRHYHYAARRAQAALDALSRLALQAVPTQWLCRPAFHLGLRDQITVYDACYLALAERLKCPLVTEDLDLIRRARPRAAVPLSRLADII